MKKGMSWEPIYIEVEGKNTTEMYRSPRLDWLSTIPSVVLLLAYIIVCMVISSLPDNGFLGVLIFLPMTNIVVTKLVTKDDSVKSLNKTINLYLIMGLILFSVDFYNQNYYGVGSGLLYLGVGLKAWYKFLSSSKRYCLN